MNPDVLKYSQDILDSINTIDFHLSTVSTIAQYTSNITIMDAVERRLSIIGEALWQINKIEPLVNVTDKIKIIGLRHILVHDYDLIDDPTIWRICQNNLPDLKNEILALIVN